MSDKPKKNQNPPVIPALFATIHFRSAQRPDGYTDEDIQALNAIANEPKLKPTK